MTTYTYINTRDRNPTDIYLYDTYKQLAQIATIQLRIATREQLKRLGRKGESYNDIIEALMIEHSGNPAIDSLIQIGYQVENPSIDTPKN